MVKKYIAPETEIIEIGMEDVIVTSVTGDPNTSGDNELPYAPYPNQ